MPQALVTNVYGLYYTVMYNGSHINCFLQGKLKRDKSLKIFTNPVAVGDTVEFEHTEDGQGIISGIIERKNTFTRKEKGRNTKEDIIAANVDRVLVIQSIAEPQINLRFVDRVAVRAAKDNIALTLCINKMDLASKEHKYYIRDYYKNSNLDYYFVSALKNKNISKIKKIIENQRTLIIGASGVGKSSIVNSIFPNLNLKTSEVSQSTKKGRHTTTNVNMYFADNKTQIIDTPGMREFGIMSVEPHLLSRYFYEFKDVLPNCNFKTCTHDHEPGCAVKEMVDDDQIYYGRYISYINILNSIRD